MTLTPTRFPAKILTAHSYRIRKHILRSSAILSCRRTFTTSLGARSLAKPVAGTQADPDRQDKVQPEHDANHHANPTQSRNPAQSTVANERVYQSASDKLFQDALKEEEEADQSNVDAKLSSLVSRHQYPNWDGDERVEDTVLRMLVDKYKPLRSGNLQPAGKKLKGVSDKLVNAGTGRTGGEEDSKLMFEDIEREIRMEQPEDAHFEGAREDAPEPVTLGGATGGVRTQTSQMRVNAAPSTGSWATEPLLPSKEGHQPWHTVFKAPTHATASIKAAHIPSSPRSTRSNAPLDEKSRRQLVEERKKVQMAGRLTRAKESTLDYKLGIRAGGAGQEGPAMRANPVSMRGWNSLIEEKIEKARQQGVFKSIKGRGQPITRVTEEFNPFIAREEFLMNRIVQRNGAAPPWVEIQTELESSVNSFRQILRQSWIRHAVRSLTATTPKPLLLKYTLENIQSFRDKEWEQREQSYHEAAVEELNSLVRKHNGLAPYAVRRPYYMRKVEIEMLYEGCAEDILKNLREALAKDGLPPSSSINNGGGDDDRGGQGSALGSGDNQISDAKGIAPSWRLKDVIVSLLNGLTSTWKR